MPETSDRLLRLFDVVASALALAAAAPVLLLVAGAAFCQGRPIFYLSKRVGRWGRPFHMYKFRTMAAGADAAGPLAVRAGDSRVTPLGRVLRKLKLDELPQLVNVLRGEMSLVGPRPELWAYRDTLGRKPAPVFALRPGLTDWASIWNIDEAALLSNYEDADLAYRTIIHPVKRELQVVYAARRGLGYNLRILTATVLRLAFGVRWFPREVREAIDALSPGCGEGCSRRADTGAASKRFLDGLISAGGLILLAPLFVLVAMLILAESGWPVFFSQERVGMNFRRFQILKFRTMRVRARGPLITIRGDPRVTSVGRMLRASKVDELPQLWNVLKGEMSLVGPRPEVPEYVSRFRSRYERILTIRPGMTDLASIRFRKEEELLAAASEPLREYLDHILPLKLDLADEYLATASVSQDLSILLQTAVAIARK